jgi:hypothetical protein
MAFERIPRTQTFHTAGRQTIENGIFDLSTATDNCSCDCHKSPDEVDKLLAAYPDVTNDAFRAWYCKAIYAMGCQQFSDLAERARKGRTPARYFSSLLKARLGGRLKWRDYERQLRSIGAVTCCSA